MKITVHFSSCFFQPKALGQTLLSEVFLRGNLIESDYFGLEFQNMQMNWVRTPAGGDEYLPRLNADRERMQSFQSSHHEPLSVRLPQLQTARTLTHTVQQARLGHLCGPLSFSQ